MTYKVMILAFLCILGLLNFCNEDRKRDSNDRLSYAGSSDASKSVKIDSDWRVSATSVKPAEDLVDIQLINNSYGKAVGANGTIFETQDGGQSWQKLAGGLPANPDFARIWFVNKSLGWVVIVKSRPSTSGAENYYDGFLMRTEDSGKTWSLQYKVKNGSLNQIRFVNDREGWAVGTTRGTDNGDQSEHPLILHTLDGGLHWTDAFKPTTFADAEDSVEDLYFETASSGSFLTANGTILSTSNAGGNWNSIKIPDTDYPQLANLRLMMDQMRRLWVLSSANSREVVATVLSRMDPNSQWAKIHLADWYISDVKFLSGSQVVICGFIGRKLRDQALRETEGIVAFSSDDGKTWKIIFKTKDAPRINALAIVSPDQLLALGDKGWVFRIQRFS